MFRLTTIRSHDQYNTTIYGLDDRYRGVFGRRDVVFMSKADLAAHNLEHGDLVDIETVVHNGGHNRIEGFTVISYDIARGSVAAYYPEANPLIPLSYQRRPKRHAVIQIRPRADYAPCCVIRKSRRKRGTKPLAERAMVSMSDHHRSLITTVEF